MIFVILGTQQFPFDRLLKALDAAKADGSIQDEIVAQTGFSQYTPQNYAFRPFYDHAEFDRMIQKADVIVTHGGVGSILGATRAGKPTVVVPRLARFGEHVDDHQCQVAEAFRQRGIVLQCRNLDELPACIEKSKTTAFSQYVPAKQGILPRIRKFLEEN